jgi:hypothetical protein
MATITTKYSFGDTVYLKTDPEQFPRMVTGFDVKPNGILYLLSLGTANSYHFDMEISVEKDVLKSITQYQEQ